MQAFCCWGENAPKRLGCSFSTWVRRRCPGDASETGPRCAPSPPDTPRGTAVCRSRAELLFLSAAGFRANELLQGRSLEGKTKGCRLPASRNFSTSRRGMTPGFNFVPSHVGYVGTQLHGETRPRQATTFMIVTDTGGERAQSYLTEHSERVCAGLWASVPTQGRANIDMYLFSH